MTGLGGRREKSWLGRGLHLLGCQDRAPSLSHGASDAEREPTVSDPSSGGIPGLGASWSPPEAKTKACVLPTARGRGVGWVPALTAGALAGALPPGWAPQPGRWRRGGAEREDDGRAAGGNGRVFHGCLAGDLSGNGFRSDCYLPRPRSETSSDLNVRPPLSLGSGEPSSTQAGSGRAARALGRHAWGLRGCSDTNS